MTAVPGPEETVGTDARRVPGLDTLGGAFLTFWKFPTPVILAIKLLVFTAARLALWGWTWWDLAVVVGIALYWPLQEWTAHMLLLHWKPRRIAGVRVDPWAARVHRAHHRDPWLLENVFVPFRVILALIPVNIALWSLILPTWRLSLTGIVAFTCAALIYEWVHYLVHTMYRPRGGYYRRIWRNHRLHHFKNEHYWHAFTVPHVDTLLGTDPDPGAVPSSPTVRTLGVDDGPLPGN